MFVVRNTSVAQHILEEWWHIPLHEPEMGHKWPLEQDAVNQIIVPRWAKHGRIKIIDYSHLNGRDGYFIRHLVQMSTDERTLILRDLCVETAGVVEDQAEGQTISLECKHDRNGNAAIMSLPVLRRVHPSIRLPRAYP